jgi:hypothetical protein
MRIPYCVGIIVVLFIAFFGSLWVRDRARNRLCKDADPFMREGNAKSEWLLTYDKILYSSAQSKRIALVEQYVDLMPVTLRERYRRYRVIRIIPVVIFATIVLVGIVARWLCI